MREVQVTSFSPDPHAALEVVKFNNLSTHFLQYQGTKERLCKKWIPDYGTHAVYLIRRAI
jgi:hypothetical protein